MNMNKIVTVLAVLVVSFSNVRAESALAFFRHITVEDGLSSNQVRSLIQDDDGYIWIGTDQGLNRYDGYGFKVYTLPDQWKGATLLALLEVESVMWIGTDVGLFVFDKTTQTITRAEIRTQEGEYVTAEINRISKDKDGNMWISTYGQGAFRYDAATDILKRFPLENIQGKLSSVYVDSSNQVWALTNWGSPVIYKLNKSNDAFEPFDLYFRQCPPASGGLVLMEDSSKRFWLGSWEDGLYEIDRVTGNAHLRIGSSSTSHGMNHIHSIIEYDPQRLLVGSDDGLLLFDTYSHDCEWITENKATDTALSDRFVYPLLKDKEGSLWVGTYYGGLNYHSPFSCMFDGFSNDPYDEDSVKGKVFGKFCEDSDHNIWIASDDGGLNCYDVKTGKFTNYRNIPGKNSLSYDNVHALCMDGDDLWIGTYTGGVNVLNVKTGKFRYYRPVEGDSTSIDGTSAYAIFKDRNELIWIATMSGINRYDRDNDCFIRLKKTDYQIMDIDQDAEGNLWFCTQGGGLLKYEESLDKWTTYVNGQGSGTLPGNYVNCGLLDSTGKMWFGTNSGLCHYDPVTDCFEVLPMSRTLSNICGLVEDKNVLWITTTHGLVRYGSGGNMHVFSTSNGLCSNQFIINSIFKASDGRIYAGTTGGFNAFYPYQINTNRAAPNIEILSLIVDNEQVVPYYSESGLATIEMSYRDNSLNLIYASLSFFEPYKNQYAYMLEGFDNDWKYVGNTTQATYTNIPAGTYTFKVTGTNNDAVWSEEVATMEIIVHPHPLLTTAFKILYVVMGVILLFVVILVVLKVNDKKHQMAIVELEKKKEKELYESKINFFTMIAHEIRTPVSLIIGPLEKVLRKSDKVPEQVVDDLKIVERNSQRLLYLVSQLLDFRKVEQNSMVMRFTTQPIEPLLRSICERFEPTISHNGARLQVIYPQSPLVVSIDAEALTKLISNLLTNASKYTKDLVRVSCCPDPSDPSRFMISVYDNGCGISKTEQDKIFQPFYQTMENKPGTGIGLSLVKSIAELHGGYVSLVSEPGSFSEFIVTLPIYHEEPVHKQIFDEKQISQTQSIDDVLNMEIVDILPESKQMVLIVDDNEEIVHFIADSLSDRYAVLSAYDGIQALNIVNETPELALIIADWMMPGLDGIGLCRKLRDNLQTCHIPFILLTAKTDDASKVSGMDCGADIYIEKPFSLQYLEACVKNIIAMRGVLRQRYASSPLTPLISVANNSMDNRFLQNMTNLIEEHMSDSNLSVDFLTEQMGISRSSFYNKIKSLTDTTPNELIQLMRLKRAAQLLKEQKYRINEVCYMVGFNNPSYFSKCFAKQFGMKPGEFMSKPTE